MPARFIAFRKSHTAYREPPSRSRSAFYLLNRRENRITWGNGEYDPQAAYRNPQAALALALGFLPPDSSKSGISVGNRIMVIWLEPAKKDLRNIHDHIVFDSKFYARKEVFLRIVSGGSKGCPQVHSECLLEIKFVFF